MALTAKRWGMALSAGIEKMSLYGGASVGMRTMLDALVPAAEALIAGKIILDSCRL